LDKKIENNGPTIRQSFLAQKLGKKKIEIDRAKKIKPAL
jgi:hypothetical protein